MYIYDGKEYKAPGEFGTGETKINGKNYECIPESDNYYKPFQDKNSRRYIFSDQYNTEYLIEYFNEKEIKDCIFSGKLFVKDDTIKQLLFTDVWFEDEVIINPKNSNSNLKIVFKGCHFRKKLKIRSAEVGSYEIQQENKIKLKALKIIDCTTVNEAYLRIGFLDVENFELSNLRLPKNAELNIGDCHFNKFKLTNFRNVGKFKLFKINILEKEKIYNPRFQIDNTSIGKTDFQSLNIASFARVIMFDNIFSNIDYTNMQWKKEVEVGQFNNNDKTELAKKRDTYRTLKNVAQKNNDQPQALIFYAQEMKNHKELTCLNKNKIDNKKDIAILRFNDWTNEFGLNWKRPLFYQLIPISIAAYLGLLFTLGVPICVIGHWHYYFEFLNPLHKTQFIGNHWNFFTYAIDFLFRIIEGLLIYQTIQAFRKYSRKL